MKETYLYRLMRAIRLALAIWSPLAGIRARLDPVWLNQADPYELIDLRTAWSVAANIWEV